MGEVAVLHSEPLHFECNDIKHVTEEDVYPPKSNPECLPGENSSQSIKANHLQDKGYMEYGWFLVHMLFSSFQIVAFPALLLKS